MSIQDVIAFLEDLGVTTPIYPFAFPASSPTEAVIVEVGQGANTRGSVMEITLTITVRAGHPSVGEKIGQELIDKLKDLSDVMVGENTQFIMVKSQQLLPYPLGKDVNNNHFYMLNFRALATQ